MTDRELLELAAKAVGYTINAAQQAARDKLGDPEKAGLWIDSESTWWNPLRDDGHALRLAVKLSIRILHPCIESQTGYPNAVRAGTFDKGEVEEMYEDNDDDPDAATRRAITRVAAEIGRVKP